MTDTSAGWDIAPDTDAFAAPPPAPDADPSASTVHRSGDAARAPKPFHYRTEGELPLAELLRVAPGLRRYRGTVPDATVLFVHAATRAGAPVRVSPRATHDCVFLDRGDLAVLRAGLDVPRVDEALALLVSLNAA